MVIVMECKHNIKERCEESYTNIAVCALCIAKVNNRLQKDIYHKLDDTTNKIIRKIEELERNKVTADMDKPRFTGIKQREQKKPVPEIIIDK